MTDVTYYLCDVCGTMHLTRKRALECEAFHVLPVSIVDSQAEPRGMNNDGVPPRIKVKMSNNKTYIYRREA